MANFPRPQSHFSEAFARVYNARTVRMQVDEQRKERFANAVKLTAAETEKFLQNSTKQALDIINSDNTDEAKQTALARQRDLFQIGLLPAISQLKLGEQAAIKHGVDPSQLPITAGAYFQQKLAAYDQAVAAAQGAYVSPERKGEVAAQQTLGQEKAGVPAPAESPIGKLIQDREKFVRIYGEDSEQVKAFDEATQAELKGGSEKLSQTSTIRNQFIQLSKNFVEVRDAFQRIRDVSVEPSAASDVAVIFNFMKMLDPQSVVREGEFATAQNAAGVQDRVRNIYNRFLSGERLTDAQRSDFIKQAETLYSAQLRSQSRLEDEFKRIAKNQGVSPSAVVVDFKIAEDEDVLRKALSKKK